MASEEDTQPYKKAQPSTNIDKYSFYFNRFRLIHKIDSPRQLNLYGNRLVGCSSRIERKRNKKYSGCRSTPFLPFSPLHC